MTIYKKRVVPGSFWLRLGRWLLFFYAALILAISLAGTAMLPAYARMHWEAFSPNFSWTQEQIDTGLVQLGWSKMVPFYMELGRGLTIMLVNVGLGLFLLWRRHPSLFTLFLAFTYFSFSVGDVLYKPLLDIIPYLHPVTTFFERAGWQLFFIVFFFFPDGHPVPGWTRWLAFSWLGFIVVQSFLGEVGDQLSQKYLWIFIGLVLGALVSQVYRYFWRSNGIQRQQMKWVLGIIILYIVFIGAVSPVAFQPPTGEDLGFSLILAFAVMFIVNALFALFPVAVTIAIFRYHLWDIDLVIRRTLVYTLMTFLLGLVYFGLVTLLQSSFASSSGQTSPFALVVSTLAIAALFNPVRRRVQEFIDRRFYRQKYDAERALEQFADSARREVGIAALTSELVSVVDKTVQPEAISMWLRKEH